MQSKFSDLNIIKSKINLGYAGGCNLGSKYAKGEYLLFLNNDTIHNPSFITKLVNKIESEDNIASVQPKIININNPEFFDYSGACGGYMDYLVYPFTRGRIFDTIEKDNKQYDKSCKIFWASGAGFITRKNIFDKLSGFDADLFAHMEEIDYHWKCHLMGYTVWVEPAAVVYHHGGKTLSASSAVKTYLNHRNSLILLLSNYSLGLSLYLFVLRFFLEIISSLKDLFTFRLNHFIAHYKSIFWIIINFNLISKKRKIINTIRKKSDLELLENKIILNQSIVKLYFINKKKTYTDLEI